MPNILPVSDLRNYNEVLKIAKLENLCFDQKWQRQVCGYGYGRL